MKGQGEKAIVGGPSILGVGNTRRVLSFHYHINRIVTLPLFDLLNSSMKPQVEEVEDDLAAEEENKLINEVCWQIQV